MTFTRRTFGKAALAGIGGMALSPFMQNTLTNAEAAQDASEEMRKSLITTVDNPILVDDAVHKRFSSSEHAFNSYSRDIGKPWFVVAAENRKELNSQNFISDGVEVKDKKEVRAINAFASGFLAINSVVGGYAHGAENTGVLSWNTIAVPPDQRIPPDETDPDVLARQAKVYARICGADLVGIAPLDRRWVYSSTQVNPQIGVGEPKLKQIVFRDVLEAQNTETELVIPESVNNVIVMAFQMNHELYQYSSTPISSGIGDLNYIRMGVAVTCLAEFIRAQGYVAIPSKNGLGPNVPVAIEAGLGEASRIGICISPEFGPRMRLAKVYTNMPLRHDKAIKFGVETFCETCKKCATACPSGALPMGPRTWAGEDGTNNHGVFKWYKDNKACLQYCMKNGGMCSTCVRSCTYNKGDMWLHGAMHGVIDKVPALNPLWVPMDDLFGYGEMADLDKLWTRDYAPYGLNNLKPNSGKE